ncbi:MAG: hypothetical protein C5B50_07160 [Verrucomicrobia bacterium]|nr:MAG: hypothetical protein C5B50_07160 [Verrucomicrobiota bacterium]
MCSAVAVSIGFFFRNHYFILLLPVMALLVGIGVSRSIHVLLYDHTIELVLAVPVLILFVAGVGATLIGNGGFWFGSSPGKVVDDIYGSTIFSEAARAAEYLRLHTPENARVAVLGSEPEIYFYSRRQAGTGYLYAYPLVESQPYARKMQDEMISEIERSRPDYVLYVDDVLSWMPEPRCDRRIFDWWRSYGAANFELVSALPITGTKEAEIPINPSTPFGNNILILTRKK